MVIAVLLIVAAAAVFTVARGKLGAWFAKPGEPPQRVIVVSPAGPTLWQRVAGTIVAALIILIPVMLLLKYTGEQHDPATNYNAPTVTSTTFPATTTDVTPQNTPGGRR
ncbi:hypothetical protein KGQ20_39805 [Catenulispora sp. NF23]|uniref:hypothetical protein n=1 Tax=Catenulispora pinistramenti TaxID=2705254 RepID=UPI001BA6D7F9|nr:hypothetical protein [Catenulispora pinistramenti]MBS2538910.1 hypothetical protein [Catenulispora pinistramenti]